MLRESEIVNRSVAFLRYNLHIGAIFNGRWSRRVKQEVTLGGSIYIEKRTGGLRCGLTRQEVVEDRWSPDQF